MWGPWRGRHGNDDGDDNKDDDDNDPDHDNDDEVCKQQPLAFSGYANYIILWLGLLFTVLSKIIKTYHFSWFFSSLGTENFSTDLTRIYFYISLEVQMCRILCFIMWAKASLICYDALFSIILWFKQLFWF